MGLCQQLCSLYRLAAAERGRPAQYPRHSEATLLFREEEEGEAAATTADRTRCPDALREQGLRQLSMVEARHERRRRSGKP